MPTPFIGRLVKLGVAKESSRGVGVAPSIWVPRVGLTVEDVAEKVASQEAYGNIWQHGAEELVVGKHSEGDVEIEAGNEILALFLLATFGTVNSASSSGAYEHTFSLQADNAHDSLTLTVIDEVDQVQFERAMVSSLDLELNVGELLMATIGFMANPHTDTSGHSFSRSTDYKFSHKDLSFKIADATGDLDAASKIKLKGISLSINKNVVLDNVLGTLAPNDILNQAFEITGQIELNFEDRTYRDYMLDGSYKAVRIDLTNTDITIGSTNPQFRLDLSRVAFSDWTKDQPNDELVKQTISFKALYDPTNGNVVNDCSLTNETASY
jgi:hypothetical protein